MWFILVGYARRISAISVWITIHGMHFVWSVLVHILCTENINIHKCIDQRNVLLEVVRNAAELPQTFDPHHGKNEEEQRYYSWQIIRNEFSVIYNGKETKKCYAYAR